MIDSLTLFDIWKGILLTQSQTLDEHIFNPYTEMAQIECRVDGNAILPFKWCLEIDEFKSELSFVTSNRRIGKN